MKTGTEPDRHDIVGIVATHAEETLRRLEESLWKPATRFDPSYMDGVLAEGFFEFGRSGRVWSREDVIQAEARDIGVQLPLPDFAVQMIGAAVALVTYRTIAVDTTGEDGNRASVWHRLETGWKLVFHQGTPVSE